MTSFELSGDRLSIDLMFWMALVMALVCGGFIQARLSKRHPELLHRLPAPFSTSKDGKISPTPGWFQLVVYRHLALGDWLLSSICITNLISWLFLVASLFASCEFRLTSA